MDIQTLRKARRYARRHFNRNHTHGHASHAAAAALEAAAEKYDLPREVCGWADATGRSGVQYLNTGDAYDLTLTVKSDYATARFAVTWWPSYFPYAR